MVADRYRVVRFATATSPRQSANAAVARSSASVLPGNGWPAVPRSVPERPITTSEPSGRTWAKVSPYPAFRPVLVSCAGSGATYRSPFLAQPSVVSEVPMRSACCPPASTVTVCGCSPAAIP